MNSLLEAQQVTKYFPVTKGLLLSRTVGFIRAVDHVTFSIKHGETFGLVGESGCGKSTVGKLILNLERPTSGSILFQGRDVSGVMGQAKREYHSSVQAVFQDPTSSLNPRMRIDEIVTEPLIANRRMSKKEMHEIMEQALAKVGLRAGAARQFPHEFSGGQRQRIALARALVLNPSLIILDEPVSSLDVSIQAQIMNLFRELQGQLEIAYLFIAHNLATVRYMSHRIGVMYLGKLVEDGPAEEVYAHRQHPYTEALFSAALPSHPDAIKEEVILQGEVPSAFNPPPGCRFHSRCGRALPVCTELEPEMKEVSPGHRLACHFS